MRKKEHNFFFELYIYNNFIEEQQQQKKLQMGHNKAEANPHIEVVSLNYLQKKKKFQKNLRLESKCKKNTLLYNIKSIRNKLPYMYYIKYKYIL